MKTFTHESKRNTLQYSGSSEAQTGLRSRQGSKVNLYFNALRSLAIFGVLPLAMVTTAKASVLELDNVTITSPTSGQCSGATGGVLDLSSTGTASLNFGNPSGFGSTEVCGARLTGGTTTPFTGTTLTLSPTVFDYPSSEICATVFCNPDPLSFNDYIRLIFTSQTTGIIEDGGFTEPSGAVAGGSFILDFSFNAPNGGGVPEPSSFFLLGTGLVFAGLFSVRSRKRATLATIAKSRSSVNS